MTGPTPVELDAAAFDDALNNATILAAIAQRIRRTDDGCWTWTGVIHKDGYGLLTHGHAAREYAHRLAYMLLVGPIPDGLQLDHLCRKRACCNPLHLEPVTCRENVLRGISFSAVNAARECCVNGHEFTPENTYRVTTGKRTGNRACRACGAASARRNRARRQAAS